MITCSCRVKSRQVIISLSICFKSFLTRNNVVDVKQISYNSEMKSSATRRCPCLASCVKREANRSKHGGPAHHGQGVVEGVDSQLPSLISLSIFVWSILEAYPKNNWMRGEQACLILGSTWGPREPKITTFSGRTALHLAACEGHLACVRWFKYDCK